MSSINEIEHLEKIAADSWYARGANIRTIEYSFRIFARHIRGESILELGPAEGIMTNLLASLARKFTIVDGSARFCDDLRKRFPNATVVHSLFEDYRTEERFDNIVLGHVLEHVADPVEILRMVKSLLKPGGRVLAAVPNARSLHRQAAVVMGLLPFEEGMNEADMHHGHRRVFTPETFRHAFLQAGLRIEIFGGYWLKPVSSRQIEETWTPEMLEAFMQLGERYPDIAGEIYVIARLPPEK
ncbi:MAG TPA: class I SAM-dependent methyltransferase [Verrucomicrobiae bacterium]|jgi:2-polyprenyl-3-methyl-5-hydroxy-6-metoxy-1,4-benzoquinol methylase|nr:class I SAM-dependent methyltransferase [Verrucomicrobiae bacterium]